MPEIYWPIVGSYFCGTVCGGAVYRLMADVAYCAVVIIRTQIFLLSFLGARRDGGPASPPSLTSAPCTVAKTC